MLQRLDALKEPWNIDDILRNEAVPMGNDQRPIIYDMTPWRKMFSPRQQLAHGLCVQVLRELVDEDRAKGELDDARKATWCYVALALDKLIARNCLMSRWVSQTGVVSNIFDSHDFGFKLSYAEMSIVILGLGLE